MKIIVSIVLCLLTSRSGAVNFSNATVNERSGRSIPKNLVDYVRLCDTPLNAGEIICNSFNDYTTVDSNGNQALDTNCDATGTINCLNPQDPRPLEYCTGLTPYCVKTANTPARCSSTPNVLAAGPPAVTCPLKTDFPCQDVGDFPDTEDCRKFWRCELKTLVKSVLGQFKIEATAVICPPATVFDPTIESRCRYVGAAQANNKTLCINIRRLCGANTVQVLPLTYPWLPSSKGQYVATCQGPLKPYVTFCPAGYDPSFTAIPATCNLNCRNPYGRIRAYLDPTKYYICIPTNNSGSYIPVLQSCPAFQTFDPTTEQCQTFFGDFSNLG